MKNLKKVLSLALAFAMVLGLVVVGSAQDVTTLKDWDTVTDKDAALLLNAFEIMKGDADGNFYPENDVTRAEAAAMISRALWGGKDTPTLYAGGNVGGYVDVIPGYWYMGYINYLTVIGVMTGKLEGKFDPDGNVTGYELLKMCLVAVGYDATTEGLTGAGWDLRTMALATQRGYTDLTAGTTVTDWNAPLSRMNAATIIANMIYREMVAYDEGRVVVVTEGTPAVEVTFGVDVLGMLQRSGILLANQYGTIGHTTGIDPTKSTDNAVVNVDTDGEGDYAEFTVTMGSTILDLGTHVVVYFVDEVSQDGVLSAALSGTTVLNVTQDKETGAPNNYDASFPGTGDYSYGVVTDPIYAEGMTYDLDNNGLVDLGNTLYYENISEVTGVVTDETYGTVYLFNDKEWDVEDYEDGTIVEGTDLVFASKTTGEAVKGSKILHTTTDDNAFGGTYTFAHVLGEVEGKVTKFSPSTPYTFAVDGVTYFTTWYSSVGVGFGSEGIFYLDPDGNVILFSDPEEAEVATTYAVVYEAGYEGIGTGTGISSTTSAIVEVSAVLEDGTKDTFEVKSVSFADAPDVVYNMKSQSGAKLTGTMVATDGTEKEGLFNSTDGALYGAWTQDGTETATPLFVQYTLNSDGTINLIFESVTLETETTIAVSGSTTRTNVGFLTSDTVTFVLADPDDYTSWKAVKGTGLAAGDYTAEYLTDTYFGGESKVTYIMATATTVDTDEVAKFFYIVANEGISSATDDGTPLYTIVFFDADSGEFSTIETTTTVPAGTYWTTYDPENGTFSNEDGFSWSWNKGFATTVENGLIVITKGENTYAGTDETSSVYTVNSDTVYYLVDGENTAAMKLSDLSTQKVVDGAAVSGNVFDYYKTMVFDAEWADSSDADYGVADIVIVYKDTQGDYIGSWDGTDFTPAS